MRPTSVKGVLLVDNHVLLLKNSRDEWELPGGRPDEGEDHAQTLAREFAEELSLDVRVDRQIDSYLFEVIPGRHVFIITYGCVLAGELDPRLSDEHSGHCLWPVERLSELNNLRGGYRRSIEAWRFRQATRVMLMLHHLSFAVSDLPRSASFYDAVLAPLGYVRVFTQESGAGRKESAVGSRATRGRG